MRRTQVRKRRPRTRDDGHRYWLDLRTPSGRVLPI